VRTPDDTTTCSLGAREFSRRIMRTTCSRLDEFPYLAKCHLHNCDTTNDRLLDVLLTTVHAYPLCSPRVFARKRTRVYDHVQRRNGATSDSDRIEQVLNDSLNAECKMQTGWRFSAH
jgi:hypothetical protein